MNKIIIGSVLPLALSIGTAAIAEDLNDSQRLVCSTAEIYECTLDEGCQDTSADTANIPALLHVDYAAGKITGRLDDGSEVTSNARHKEILESKLIMQGVEQGYEGGRDGSAWSLAITVDSAEMVLSFSTDESGFVILGSCEPE